MSNVAASNFTSLYNSNASPIVPSMPYGNANVVSLLNVGTDGANTVGNIDAAGIISAAGNIATAAFFIGDGSRITNLPDGNYGNANVEALLATYNGPITGSTISATGNITGSYFVGNGSLLTGIASSSTYGNANVAAFLPTYTGNIAGGNITVSGAVSGATVAGNGAALSSLTGANVTGTVANATFATTAGAATTAGTVTTAAQPNITSVGTMTSITSTGNIAGNYFVGNGSLLTGISGTGTYGNANVAAYLPTYTGNLGAGNITATGFITTPGGISVSGTTAITALTASIIGLNVTATDALVAGGNLVAGNIRSNGILTAVGNIIGGNVNTSGNVTGAYIKGDGSLLTGITSTLPNNISVSGNILAGGNITSNLTITAGYATIVNDISAYTLTTLGNVDIGGNLEVAGNIFAPLSLISGGNLVATGSGRGFISAQANVTGGNLHTAGIVSAGGNITAVGNIAGNYFQGNGSLLTGITTTYGNANVAAFLPGYDGNILANVITAATITGVNKITTSVLTATGYVYVGAPGFAPATLSSTGSLIGNTITANLSITSSDTISATGNITGGNINTGGNVTGTYIKGNGSLLTGIPGTAAGGSPTQVQYARSDSTFGGMAYMTYNDSNGNIAIQNTLLNTANVITTVQPFNDALQSATVTNPGRIQIGTGYNSNTSASVDPSNWNRGALVDIFQNITKGDNGRRTTALNVEIPVELTANIANSSTRLSGGRQALQIGGGANAYSMTSTNFSAWPSALTAVVQAGPNGNILVGNVALTGAVAINGSLDTGGTSTIATGIGYRQQFNGLFTTATGMVTGFSLNAPGTTVSVIRNESGYHNSNARSSTDYLFLNNNDNAAQNKMGSLRTYHELNYTGNGTSGDVYISKNNGQVQQITPTGTITAMYFSDFVVSASDGVNTDQQADTVTVIIAQGATAYTVTMPSGSTYKYSGGTNTVSTTANSVTMISITAVNISGVTTYLITISPGFV